MTAVVDDRVGQLLPNTTKILENYKKSIAGRWWRTPQTWDSGGFEHTPEARRVNGDPASKPLHRRFGSQPSHSAAGVQRDNRRGPSTDTRDRSARPTGFAQPPVLAGVARQLGVKS